MTIKAIGQIGAKRGVTGTRGVHDVNGLTWRVGTNSRSLHDRPACPNGDYNFAVVVTQLLQGFLVVRGPRQLHGFDFIGRQHVDVANGGTKARWSEGLEWLPRAHVDRDGRPALVRSINHLSNPCGVVPTQHGVAREMEMNEILGKRVKNILGTERVIRPSISEHGALATLIDH